MNDRKVSIAELKEKLKSSYNRGVEKGKSLERNRFLDACNIFFICPICGKMSIVCSKSEFERSKRIKNIECLNCLAKFKSLKNGRLKLQK